MVVTWWVIVAVIQLALAMCDHPNIVKLICSLHSADEHALVMECVRGHTLSEAVTAPGYGFAQQVTQQVQQPCPILPRPILPCLILPLQ